MSADPVQLIWLLLAGAVVLVGSRYELRQVRWGPTAWKLMVGAFALAVIVVAVLLARQAMAPRPPVVIPREGAILT